MLVTHFTLAVSVCDDRGEGGGVAAGRDPAGCTGGGVGCGIRPGGNTHRVHRFSAATTSQAVVAAERSRIWAILTDPVLLPRLTPLLRRIEVVDGAAETADDGGIWRWHLAGLSVLGVGVSPVFTERMRFERGRRIDFSHDPPDGAVERTGAEGSYVLDDAPDGTRLAIELTLHVELPLSRLARPAVSGVMRATMAHMGDRFSANLLRHLSADGTARRR